MLKRFIPLLLIFICSLSSVMAQESFKFSCYDYKGVMLKDIPENVNLQTRCLDCSSKTPRTTLTFNKDERNKYSYKVNFVRHESSMKKKDFIDDAVVFASRNGNDYYFFQEFFEDGYAHHVFYKDLKIKITNVTITEKKDEQNKLYTTLTVQNCDEIKETKKEKTNPSIDPNNISSEKIG